MPLAIRRYQPGDADAVWELHVRALRDAGIYDEEYAHLDTDLRNVRAAYLDAGGEFLVGERQGAGDAPTGVAGVRGADDSTIELGSVGARERTLTDESTGDREIVAMGALQPATVVDHHETDPEAGVIRRMRVAPAWQRHGFGSAILGELERRASALGFERLVLDTTEQQSAATAFYESFGYAETRREDTPVGEMVLYEKNF